MQNSPSLKENHMIKSLKSMPTTFKMVIGLTLFYFVCKTLGNR